MNRYVYLFKEGSALMRAMLGLKGSRLAEMFRMGLPVPPGMIISTEACAQYFERNRTHVASVHDEVRDKLEILEKSLNQKLGHERDPLLLMVRPGAEVQMPGQLRDLANVGMNDKSVFGLARRCGNERFAWDTYRKFIEDFSMTAMQVHQNRLQSIRDKLLKAKSLQRVSDLSVSDLMLLVNDYMKMIHRYAGRKFPQDPEEQLWMAIEAQYEVWRHPRIVAFRRMNDILHLRGTGLTLQQSVFGSLNPRSGSGCIFTRNPITGEKGLYGQYLMHTSLGSVTGGTVVPRPIEELRQVQPRVYLQLEEYGKELERHFKDVQNMQFIIEDGKLYMLYSKNAKLGAAAEVKTAVDLVHENIITRQEALANLYAPLLKYLHHQVMEPKTRSEAKGHLLATGYSGSKVSATGQALFDISKVQEWSTQGKNIVLFVTDNTADNYLSLIKVQGYVTSSGGPVSDASILARDRAIASVLSCPNLVISENKTECRLGSHTIKEGDVVTVNGQHGEVYRGEWQLVDTEIGPEYEELIRWADGYKKMAVLAIADNPTTVTLAKKLGAEGVGLCKTEYMFKTPEKLNYIRRAILAETADERKKVLEELVQYHKEDFKSLFNILNGQRCIIRILDPPLNTFLPGDAASQEKLAAELGVGVDKVIRQHKKLSQYNPTLGLRGSRLVAVYPEFLEFQAKAIFLAALESVEEGHTPLPCIELPMISTVKEFLQVKHVIAEVAEETGALEKIKYRVGVLIEIPRAALTADELAREADFMHFGSNDLTQLTCGLSQEDSQEILDSYVLSGAYAKDPFTTLDVSGVGELMKLSIEKSRKAKKKILIGLCGSQASDPASIDFCQQLGIDEISCVANNVAVAKIAAAQAAIKMGTNL